MIALRKSGADQFFISHFTASASVALLWTNYVLPLPDFVAGFAAGMILVAAIAMFLNRKRDEYTLAVWHAGTAAGFVTTVAWLVVDAISTPLRDVPIVDVRTPALLAVTAYLLAVLVKRVGGHT